MYYKQNYSSQSNLARRAQGRIGIKVLVDSYKDYMDANWDRKIQRMLIDKQMWQLSAC